MNITDVINRRWRQTRATDDTLHGLLLLEEADRLPHDLPLEQSRGELLR
jgi:hypothetical protein